MVGRERELRLLRTASSEPVGDDRLVPPVHGPRRRGRRQVAARRTSSSPASATRPRSCAAAACRTARASRTGRSPSRCADATATIHWLALAGSLDGDEAALIAERIAAAVDLGGSPGPLRRSPGPSARLLEAVAKDAAARRSSSTTCSGPSRRFLDLVEHLADWPATRRSCSSAWRGPSSSTSGRAGAAASSTPRTLLLEPL